MTHKGSPKNPSSLKILWSPLAGARLREIRAYIALDNPRAAERLATRIVALVEALRLHPGLGRSSGERGLRELVIGGTPYIICYRVRRKQIFIVTIHHAVPQK